MKISSRRLTEAEKVMAMSALLTGLIHVYVGLSQSFMTLTLAGTGFLGGTAIFLSGKFTNSLVAASIPYTAVQFIFYYQTYGLSFGPLALIDKLVQTVFIFVGIYYLKKRFSSSQSLKKFLGQ